MAEEFKKLSARWKTCDRKLQHAWSRLDSTSQTSKNTFDWLDGAQEDIVERVFAARKSGVEGKTLSDFLKVKDVKSAWSEIKKSLKTLEKAHDEYEDTAKSMTPLYKEAVEIITAAEDEVAARKQRAARKKLAIKSKSIPDLEKLANEIRAYVSKVSDKHSNSVATFPKRKRSTFLAEKRFEDSVARDIARGINSVKVNADRTTGSNELEARHLGVILKKLGDVAKKATGHCVAALRAHKAGEARAASAEFQKALKLAMLAEKTSKDIHAKFKKNSKTVKDAKDSGVRMKRLNDISTQVRDILLQVQKTQKALAQSVTG